MQAFLPHARSSSGYVTAQGYVIKFLFPWVLCDGRERKKNKKIKCRASKQPIQPKCDKGYSLTSLESALDELFSGEGCRLQDTE